MQSVMLLVLSSEGYDNYRLASGRTGQATARLTHLFLAAAKGLPAIGLAYGSFKISRNLLGLPRHMLAFVLPPFLQPFVHPFEPTVPLDLTIFFQKILG